jgi:hypothetical protein
VREGLDTATWRYRATVTVHAPATKVRTRLPSSVRVTPQGRQRCIASVGSDDPRMLASYLSMIDEDFSIDPRASPELAQALHELAARFLRAVSEG